MPSEIPTEKLQDEISDFFDTVNEQAKEVISKEGSAPKGDGNTIIMSLIQSIQSKDKTRQHNAAKAIGYLANANAINAKQKIEIKTFLIDTLHERQLSMSVAFSVLEALERIDGDAFWTLIMGWYGIVMKGTESVGTVASQSVPK